ncbi:MAG: hypothetical protein AB8G26_17655 [Ilumatobacter sp.]
MSVQAWFSNDDVDVDPGSSMTLRLTVQNLGETTKSFAIIPTGLCADWVRVERNSITVFDESLDSVDVVVTPPRLPSTTAGPTAIGLRVVPNGDPEGTVVAETTLDVQPFDDRRIVPLQPVIRSRHRANFEFMVENHGNGLASCRVRLVDPSDRIDGDFDPPAVGVQPGGASLVRLKAKAQRGAFRRTARTLEFDVEAEQQNHRPAAATMSIVQPPTVSTAALGRVAAAGVAIAAAAVAWFGIVRPEIRDTTAEQVDERVAALEQRIDDLADAVDAAPATTVADDASSDEDAPADEPVNGLVGDPDFVRLSVTPAAAETADNAFTVEAGRTFDLTDVRIENANNDTGRASLSVNGQEAFSWSLANVRGSVFEPRITPIRLEAGDNLTFSVRCDTVGNPNLGTCANSLNIGGLAIDASIDAASDG